MAVEAPILRAVEMLVPGASTVTRYIRYYALYAALAAHAAERDLDREACRRLLRRSEVIMAAAHLTVPPETPPGPAHGIDRVRAFMGERLDVARAACEGERSYSPRMWGFWSQYGGPSMTLGTVAIEDGALRPGRHACPAEVRELFEPLFAYAEADSLPAQDLDELRALTLSSEQRPEVPWLRNLFTATGRNPGASAKSHSEDRVRRATLRILARAVQLHGSGGGSVEEMVRSAVAFGDQIVRDPVLSSIEQSAHWRGVLLRNYSVGAWRRLWAALVGSMGDENGEADRTREELRMWLADQVEDVIVAKVLDGLEPLHDSSGHPYPCERRLLVGDRKEPLTNIKLLLIGGMRANGLSGVAQKAFLGGRRRGMGEFLDPIWVHYRIDEYRGRSLKDFAARLVDDMLYQSKRVAYTKMRPDPVTGRLRVFSRVHERNDRFFRTGDEGDGDIGTRLEQLGGMAVQLGLLQTDGEAWDVSTDARALLELTA